MSTLFQWYAILLDYTGEYEGNKQRISNAFQVKTHFLVGKQCGPRSDCSYRSSPLFASILISSVMLGNYLQQTASADNIFKCIFFLAL